MPALHLNTPQKVMFIPDPHAHPDHHNDRFGWAAQLAVRAGVDHIVCAGDWPEMESLCFYDKGTKGFEGRRYHRDIDAGNHALDVFNKPIKEAKRKVPKKWMLIGNHDHRIDRAIDKDAEMLDGLINLSDLQYKEHGWEVIDYEGSTPGILDLHGIAYAHYHTSGVMGKAIAGIHQAAALLTKKYRSCSVGHSHTYDVSVRTDVLGKRLRALVGGCFVDYYMPWAGNANEMWWSGLFIKHNVQDGDYDLEDVSMARLRSAFA